MRGIWRDVRRETVALGEREWIRMEATFRAVDADIHAIVLLISHQGRALMTNFNPAQEKFAKREPALRESLRSIRSG